MTDQPGIIRDLAALVRAVLYGDRTAAVYAERITSRLGISEDGAPEAAEAGLRKALVLLDREQLGTALAALEDAADYRREYQDGDCAGCEELPEGVLCGDHACDEAMAAGYDLLHGELQEHLADIVPGMVNGDDHVRAVVTIRWDKREAGCP